jgi:hypothetical protein
MLADLDSLIDNVLQTFFFVLSASSEHRIRISVQNGRQQQSDMPLASQA